MTTESKLEVLNRCALAIEHLLKNISGTKIRHLINKKLNLEKGTEGYWGEGKFSKYKNARRKPKEASQQTANKIIPILEDVLLKEYELKWDSIEKDYFPTDSNPFDQRRAIKRMKCLQGEWLGYTWDKITSDANKTEEPEGFIHIFKIKVDEEGKIVCHTEMAVLTSHRMLCVDNRVMIALVNSDRSRVLVLNIPFGVATEDELKRTNTYKLAYTDTGRTHVTAGLAIIEKTDIGFEEINPESAKFSIITRKEHAEFLREAQGVIR